MLPMVEPSNMPSAPGTESWGAQYGPIGVVAALAIAALVVWILKLFSERKEDRDRQNREQDEATKRISVLSDKLVETMGTHHRETLDLVASLTRENEQRYQVLLDRHIAETRQHAEALRAQSTATTDALSGMVKKLSKTAE